MSSDHYSPWLTEQGHAPYAWSLLGAVSQVTERVELMTYVTCPTLRYDPAVVAQKAATVQALSGGRFTLGLGAGENLNEHVVGECWPAVDARQDMLAEAVEIIRELLTGELVTYDGDWFRVDSARVWTRPRTGCRSAWRCPVRSPSSGSLRSATTSSSGGSRAGGASTPTRPRRTASRLPASSRVRRTCRTRSPAGPISTPSSRP